MKDADIYGISFFGDGATVKKAPLLNILASGVYNSAACMEIVDCSQHMEDGGRKNGKYIANQFHPYIVKCETHTPKVVDLVLFDGASNVQLAGNILNAHFPRISVVHGAKHVMSLFSMTCSRSLNYKCSLKSADLFTSFLVVDPCMHHMPFSQNIPSNTTRVRKLD